MMVHAFNPNRPAWSTEHVQNSQSCTDKQKYTTKKYKPDLVTQLETASLQSCCHSG